MSDDADATAAAAASMENFGGDDSEPEIEPEIEPTAPPNEETEVNAAAEQPTTIEAPTTTPTDDPTPTNDTKTIEQDPGNTTSTLPEQLTPSSEETTLPPPSDQPVEGELTTTTQEEDIATLTPQAETVTETETEVKTATEENPSPTPVLGTGDLGQDETEVPIEGTSTDGYVETPREFRMTAEELEAEKAAAEAALTTAPPMKFEPVEPPKSQLPPPTIKLKVTAPLSKPKPTTSTPDYFPADEKEKESEPIPTDYFPADTEAEELAKTQAALCIQGVTRRKAATKRVEEIRQQNKAAIGIQNSVRRRAATKVVEEKRQQNKAAIGIQNSVRRRAAKKRVEQIRQERNKPDRRDSVISDIDPDAPELEGPILTSDHERMSGDEDDQHPSRLPTPQLRAEEGEDTIAPIGKLKMYFFKVLRIYLYHFVCHYITRFVNIRKKYTFFLIVFISLFINFVVFCKTISAFSKSKTQNK